MAEALSTEQRGDPGSESAPCRGEDLTATHTRSWLNTGIRLLVVQTGV